MKIKILSRTKGNIVAAVLPPESGAQNLTEAGPAAMPGTKFDEVELPAATRSADLPKLLSHARIKRGKKTVSLEISKKKPSRTRAAKKPRR
jgi:hypothetical protein